MKVEFTYLTKSRVNFNSADTKRWIKKVIESEGKRPGNIHFIISGRDHIRQVNKHYLNHDYDTDVISFADNRKDIISGEIFIGAEVVGENAEYFKIEMKKELLRIMVHGVLHLMGYEDNTKEKRAIMHDKENEYLKVADSHYKI